MRRVYQAENSIDAHLVRGALEQYGIPAWVFGHYLTGGAGELPAFGLVEVHVADEHHAQAESFVRALMSGEAAEGDDALVPEPA